MKVSVVITTYNLGHFLEEAIQSVLQQTRKADEIIIADDASTDGSKRILEKYSGQVKLISQPQNIGALKNTLSGLVAATGDIVGFLDGDDTWMPSKIEKMAALFEADGSIVVASHDHERMDGNGHALNVEDDTNDNVKYITQHFEEKDWSAQFRRSILFRKGYWFGSAYMLKRSAIDFTLFQQLLEENKELARWSYLDLVMGPFITASNPKGKVGFVNEKLFRYRIHSGSTSGSTADRQKTMNSLRRSQAVNRLTYIGISRVENDPAIKKRFGELDAVHQLARYQYEGKKLAAIGQFFKIIPQLLSQHLLVKEIKRLGVTTFLGVDKFITLKNKHAGV